MANLTSIKLTSESTKATQKKINDNFSELDLKKVEVEAGKGLSQENYTTEDKNKLANISAGAEVNTIEIVKVNNVALVPDPEKAVNVSVPTQASDIDALDMAPNGTDNLIDNNKINLVYVPDAILGQLLYGGNFNATTGVATLTTNAKTKLGTSDNTITLTNDATVITGYESNEGVYYIADTAGTFAGLNFSIGDWLISIGTAWTKVDNTDAVSSVNNKTGAVVLTAQDVSALPDSTKYGYSLEVSGTTVTLKDQDGSVLSTINTQDTIYELEQATSSELGGIKAETKTDNETVEAKIDTTTGKLYVPTYPELNNDFGKIKVGSTTINSTSPEDILEIAAGTNVSINADASNKKITINATTQGTTNTEYTFTESDSRWGSLDSEGFYTLTIPSNKTPIAVFLLDDTDIKMQVMATLACDGTNIYVSTDTKFNGLVTAY